ncbi:hypothetical protein CPB83DRAFT_862279 [Crepidotus variabilis]|uniref:AAA+ ATPase domain-containing protein n=1 Tax=Crepidotus variabilis TaxID=179855 RepID=A0A9P6E767_9AGAR|nr:hypothetical protein CPB83DRAFT_862279 [Crepidotus variabilis]
MPNELYFHRVREEEVLRRMLDPEGIVGFGGQQPSGRGGCQWIVVGGAEGCGKTALLHQILASPQGSSSSTSSYVTLHLDLRFSPFGGGDMEGLYMSLNGLMVGFWEEVAEMSEIEGMGEGWELFTTVAQGFKNDRSAVEHRLTPASSALTPSANSLKSGHDFRSEKRALPRSQSTSGSKGLRTSDISRLMEMFQAGLVKYWDFEPQSKDSTLGRHSSRARHATHGINGGSEVTSSSRTKVEGEQESNLNPIEEGKLGRTSSRRWGFMAFGSTGRMRGGGSRRDRRGRSSREVRGSEETTVEREKGKEREEISEEGQSGRWLGKKKVPVIFIDEAHKLPQLIPADTLKCLLDALLVLTKQNRLCHVIHASNDPFYQSWLRSTGVLSGCKMITLGDLNKNETRRFYRERVFPRVPERIRGPLNFEVLWDAFGGRMMHWMDYVEEFVGSGGVLDVKQSSHFLQAHTLLNLHIIHASQAPGSSDPNPDQGGSANNGNTSMNHPNMSNTDTRTLHPGLGPAGFKAYAGHGGGGDTSFGSGFGFPGSTVGFSHLTPSPPPAPPPFTAMQLLKVISRLSLATTGLSSDGMTTVINPGGEPYLAYFHLCRELGVRAVDGMVRGGVLDLRWNECIGVGMPMGLLPPNNPSQGLHTRDSTMVGPGPGPMSLPMQMPSTLIAPPVSTQTSQSRQQMPPAYLTPPDRGRRPGSPFYADSAHAPSPAAVAALSVAAGVADMEDEDEYDMVPVDVNIDEDEDEDEVVMARRVNPAAVPLPPSVAPSIMMQSVAHLPLPTPAPPPPLPQSDHQTTPYQPYQLPASLPSQPQFRDSEYYAHGTNPNEDPMEGEIVGPKLVPITPIMRYAMREVVQEYEDDQSVSEYASLSDVDEY